VARILVDLLSYTGTKGGMETHTRAVYAELGRLAPQHEFVGWASDEFLELDSSWFPGEIVPSGWSGENRFAWAFAELFMVGRAARGLGADLIHSPATLGPWRSRVPAIYTMHDMLYFRSPELMATPFYTKPVQWMEQRAAGNASLILTVSRDAAADITRYLRFPASRVVPIHSAGTLDPHVPLSTGPREPALFLAVGNRLPHKNFAGLVRAIAHLPADERPRLVVTGSRGDDPLRPLVDELGVADWVDLRTWVPDDELAELYSRATALLVANFVDGFGLPILDAMLVGLPVLVSDIAVYREVAGDAAGYFDPADVASIAAALRRATTDRAWLADLAARGRIHAAGFSWERTAAETLAAFERVLADPRHPRGRRG